jgi:hypothetical protein
MRATELARTRGSAPCRRGGAELALREADVEFGPVGGSLAAPAGRVVPERIVGTGVGHPHGVLIVVCRVKAANALVAEERAVGRRVLVVDGYVRSTPRQEWSATPASIDRGLIGRCVVGRGWRVGRLFEEATATRLVDPGSRLREALERIESRESDGLVVARFKNLASSLEEAVAVLERIQAAGGRFVSVCDGIDFGGSSARTVLRLLVSVLEW